MFRDQGVSSLGLASKIWINTPDVKNSNTRFPNPAPCPMARRGLGRKRWRTSGGDSTKVLSSPLVSVSSSFYPTP